MRILRIQFENLNSLHAGDINLEDGPLARAGLFAITGPTGSGKSTLLDAITLALYGKAARYDSAPNPEAMMSRHTGHCRAEVTFEVNGAAYRAEWQLRRARGKADGNLQPPARRIYDARGAVLAEKQTEADALVEKLTGLDYPRFLRSVLLAQGQFAQFLKTSENQRAELLESLTGTVIYSELGALAYREASTREAALDEREAALGRTPLLTPEARAERQAAIASLEQTLTTLATRRKALATEIARGRQRATLCERIGKLEAARAALAQESTTLAPTLALLERHAQAEPHRAALQTLDALLSRATQEERAATEADAKAGQALSTLANGAEAARLLGQRLVADAEATLATALQTGQEAEETLARLRRSRSEHEADAALETTLSPLADALARLATLRKEATQAATALHEHEGTLTKATDTARTTHEAHERATHAEAEATQAAANALKTLHGLLQNRSLEALTAHATKLEGKQAALLRLRALMEKMDAAAEEGVNIANEEQQLTNDLEEIRLQKAATKEEEAAQARLLELARDHLARLEKAATFEDHRATLAPGEPCPLCGANEHPLIRPGANLSHEIDDARRNITTARSAHETARREAELANSHLVRTEERLRLIHKRRAELRHDQNANHDTFTQLGQTHRIYTAEQLAEAESTLQQTLAAHKEKVKAALTAQELANTAEKAALQAQAEARRLGEQAQTARTAAQSATEALTTRREAAANTANQAIQAATTLETALAPYGLTPPTAGAENALRETLETRFRHYRNLQEQEAKQTLACQKAQAGIATARQGCEQTAQQARRLEIPLPAGTPPPSGLAPKWATAPEAEAVLGTLLTEVERTRTTATHQQKQACDTRAAATRQQHEVENALGGSPFATVAAVREALLPIEEQRRLEQTREAHQRRVAENATLLHQTGEELQTLEDAPSESALASLQQEDSELEKTTLTTAEERATLRASLEEDDRARSAQDAEARAIRTAREQLATWLELRDLIGSADGRKFSRFAQGLSLDLLVRHANTHLARLSERYELRRPPGAELALEMIDHHQALATRPTASLSGGETFLVSLALALGLSDLAGRNTRVDSLFIDEGFGTLDADLLDTALAALETLQTRHKTIGIISHVELLKERVSAQIRVEKGPGGISTLRLPE